jgi:hypothetical protein
MIKSKTIPMALAMLGLGAATSFAEVKVSDSLSMSGFVDMSASGVLPDSGDATLNGNLDQYELDFMLKYGYFSARADLNMVSTAGSNVTLEQGFITAALTDGLSLSLGRFLSSSGFEAAEPTGLYQYSTSKTLVYGGYQNGLNLAYSTPMFGVYGAVVSDLWNTGETELLKTPGVEAQVSVMPVEGVTAKATVLWQTYDTTLSHGTDENQGLINVWAQYSLGKITAAAEYNQLLSWSKTYPGVIPVTKDDLSGMGWLVMANYKITDQFAATVRYSALTIDDKVSTTDDMDSEVTFSPSFAVSPHWFALAEVKQEFGNLEQTSYAVESTFSF